MWFFSQAIHYQNLTIFNFFDFEIDSTKLGLRRPSLARLAHLQEVYRNPPASCAPIDYSYQFTIRCILPLFSLSTVATASPFCTHPLKTPRSFSSMLPFYVILLIFPPKNRYFAAQMSAVANNYLLRRFPTRRRVKRGSGAGGAAAVPLRPRRVAEA